MNEVTISKWAFDTAMVSAEQPLVHGWIEELQVWGVLVPHLQLMQVVAHHPTGYDEYRFFSFKNNVKNHMENDEAEHTQE